MINRAFISDFSMISSLGFTPEEHLESLMANKSGIDHAEFAFGHQYVSAIDELILNNYRLRYEIPADFTKLEALIAISISQIKEKSGINLAHVPLFLATTKGNIDEIVSADGRRGDLQILNSAKRLQAFFNLNYTPTIVCNACTSGLQAIIMASRMIQNGQLDTAIACGVDVLADFTLRGFRSLHAMSNEPCRPFDEARDGITLGEGCSAVLLSNQDGNAHQEIIGCGTSNDANHISGPSRTGEGLKQAITSAVGMSNFTIDYINAHGTATRYNDEMEAQAFNGLSIHETPTHSLKGYWGHTLGAAGVLETAATCLAMTNGVVFKSIGYEAHGATLPLSIAKTNVEKKIDYALKTSSGFGGSNAAIILKQMP